jgi:hypothetical protein
MADIISKQIAELDTASTLAAADVLPVSQGGITRKASITQIRESLTTDAAFLAHTSDVANPHGTTAAQVGAFTTQQATSAIAAAQATVQANLTTHTAAVNNPHSTTASQVGAYSIAAANSAIGAAQTTVQNNLNAHTGSRSNPHVVTADQVGRTSPQWNADKIQTKAVTLPGTLVNRSVLTYDSATDKFTLGEEPIAATANIATLTGRVASLESDGGIDRNAFQPSFFRDSWSAIASASPNFTTTQIIFNNRSKLVNLSIGAQRSVTLNGASGAQLLMVLPSQLRPLHTTHGPAFLQGAGPAKFVILRVDPNGEVTYSLPEPASAGIPSLIGEFFYYAKVA